MTLKAMLAGCALLAAAAIAGAQGVTPITAPKSAAQRTADRANTRTAVVQGSGGQRAVQSGGQRPGSGQRAVQSGGQRPGGTGQRAVQHSQSGQGQRAVQHSQTGTQTRAATPQRGATGAQSQAGGQRAQGAAQRQGAERADTSRAVFMREVYVYRAEGRRDPFVSLLASGELRPMLQDLKLVGVLYDPTGRRPVAVMRDVTTKDQYRVTTGQQLGRMRVAQIHPKSVTFTIEEFGFSRQEVLVLGDTTRTRAQ